MTTGTGKYSKIETSQKERLKERPMLRNYVNQMIDVKYAA